MPEWVQYVRQHLALPELTRSREDEIVEDLARQLEDFYREALARGLSTAEAEEFARKQIPDWESLTSDIYRMERRSAKTKVERWAESATVINRGKPTMFSTLFTDVRQDFLFGVRMLSKNPGFTAVAVLTLALGIGANAAIFSMVNSMVLQPLPYKDSHELVRLYNTNPKRGWFSIRSSYPDFLDLKKNSKTIGELVAFTRFGVSFSAGETPLRLQGGYTTPGFFRLLGMKPLLGRAFEAGDQELSDARVVLINEEIWRRHYGADPKVLGKRAVLNGRSYTIIGVVPVVARLGDIWIPLRPSENILRRNNRFLTIVGRMKPSVTLEEAGTEIEGIARQFQKGYPDTNRDHGMRVVSLKSALVGTEDRAIVFTMLGLVGFILLIACSNVANLLLARAAARQKEMALRAALGAGRGRLARQLLTESILLAGMGGTLSLLIGYWALQTLVNMLPPFVPRLDEIKMDAWALLFTAGISIVTGIAFGLAPALQLSRQNLQECLKEGGRSSTFGGSTRLRSTLAVAQISVALALLITSGLFIKGFAELTRLDWGFNIKNILTLETTLPSVKYTSDKQVAGFYRDRMSELRTLPGVEQVALVSHLFIGQGTTMRNFVRFGDPIPKPGEPAVAAIYYAASPDYLQLMRVPLKAGRYFTEQDEREAPKVVIVNEKMAREIWPGEDPLGKQVRFYVDEEYPRTVVGVVGDTMHNDFDDSIHHQAYVPHRQSAWASMNVVLKTSGDPEAIRGLAQEVFRRADPDLPVYDIWTMEYRLSRQLQGFRTISFVLGAAGIIALSLAVMGIYGVVSYVAQQRTHEFGVRLALGARRGDILRLVLRQGMLLTSIGIGIGLAMAAGLSRLISSALQIINPNDVVSFAGLSFFLALVALIACIVPARRATKVDPMVALRYE